jgi:hypothetical protein
MTGQLGALAPRGRLRGDLLYLGWRAAVALPDPGPAPGRPEPPALDEVGADWLAAQRREQDLLARPGRLTAGAGVAVAGVAAGLWLTAVVPAGLALLAVAAGAGLAGSGARALIRGERDLRAQVGAEQHRVRQIRAVQQAQFAARTAQHTREVRDWQQRDTAHRRRPQWRPATLPAETSRVDVAGGTLAGWSALLTMLAAPRLAVGGEVTVVDLTEGGVAGDLLAVAGRLGISPRVWVLPADLPRLDLGLQLRPQALADVLALTAAAAAGPAGSGAGADPARDAALLDGVLGVLGPGASMTQLIAALRTLAQLGGPQQQLSGGVLSAGQLSALSTLHGRGAEQLVIDRAWSLEARLRVLAPLGTALVPQPRSPLRVAWTDRHGTALGNRVLGCYLTVALTEVLRQAPAGRPWQQTVCVLGADRLPGEATDRLCAAAETARAGLVLCYQSVPPPVRERLGRGNAAVAFMRLGNAEEARAAAEQIGTEHRFVISQLTETVGASLTDTAGGSYTSTVGIADSSTGSVSATLTAGQSRGRGRSTQGTFAPFAPFADFTGSISRDASASAAWSDSRSVTEGINAGTSWGWNTSRALGTSSSQAGTRQRSRELVIEQHELQHLPQTAVVLCRDGPAGREVVLADANPAIMALPTATLAVGRDAG